MHQLKVIRVVVEKAARNRGRPKWTWSEMVKEDTVIVHI